MESKNKKLLQIVKIQFESFDDYVDWALHKLKEEIPGLLVVRLIRESNGKMYRSKTYELQYRNEKFEFDFEMESDFEWYTGNIQDDPDWVYSPKSGQYQIWGGISRLAKRLSGKQSL